MTSEEREQLRLSLMRFLEANTTRYGLPTAFLLQQCRAEGRSSLDRAMVEHELEYLVDKGFVTEVLKGISPEMRAWRLTASGRDYHATLHES